MKIKSLLMLTLALCALPVFGALADAAAIVADPPQPFTWEYLATIAGAAAATLVIVQFAKAPLDKLWKIPTRWFAYFVALAILLAATAFTTGLTLSSVPLVALNAFLAALAAYGGYELTFAKSE